MGDTFVMEENEVTLSADWTQYAAPIIEELTGHSLASIQEDETDSSGTTVGDVIVDGALYDPDANENGSATIIFRAWDTNAGAAGDQVDVSTNGGLTAYSAETAEATIPVEAVNDAPVFDYTAAFTLDAIAANEPDRSLSYFSRILSLPSHSTILSQVLVSGKPGAVHH